MSLYIVPTPIGNLGDITLRAIEALREVDFIIAEDTRYSRKLLSHLGIHKRLVSLYRPRESLQVEAILELLQTRHAALISDSGTPLLSDPGAILVRRALGQGTQVVPLPGPTALIPALVGSGIRPEPFLFLGFPPRKKGELESFLRPLSTLPYTLVFYESPKRIGGLLAALHATFGPRSFALAKEISKKNEKWIRGSLDRAEFHLQGEVIAGEMVLVVEGKAPSSAKSPPPFQTPDEVFGYIKAELGISKNQIKNALMKSKKRSS